jgi:CRP-like cAMP-binding protein/class 3 adenylate cyclase
MDKPQKSGRAERTIADLGGVHAVLGLDIVSFSTLQDDDQVAAMEHLLGWINEALANYSIGEAEYRWSPAGDGGYLTFASADACRAAIDVAFSIAEKARRPRWRPRTGEKLTLTLALHAGTVTEARELGRTKNIWGTGINMTARILSIAVPGQLLVSKQYFDTYIAGQREPDFTVGDVQWRTVKHGVQMEVMNANRDELCLSDEQAKARRWQSIGNLWRKTIQEYRFLINDTMKSGEPIAALAAGKFLLDLADKDSVRELCQIIGRTDERQSAPYPLHTHYFFGLMPPEILFRMVEIAKPRLMTAGAVVCKRGDLSETCFFPVSGTLIVDVPGQDTPVRILPGAIVGEFSLWVPNIARTATVRALDDSLLLEFDRREFKQILSDAPLVAEGVYGVIKSRILQNVLKSRKLFPKGAKEQEEALSAIRAECEKYEKDAVLDLTSWVYILFSGMVRLSPPQGQPVTIEATGNFGAEQVAGIISEIGSPDGPVATVLEESVVVKLSRETLANLQRFDEIGSAWSAVCGERLRAIGKVASTDKLSPAAPAKPQEYEYDLFLSHASEDNDAIARPLYLALVAAGVSVWFDEAILQLGDSLHQKINQGLAKCRYGVVILSPRFLDKEWTQRELDGLVDRETASREKAILPIWYELDQATLSRYSPTLAGRLAGRAEEGVSGLVKKILQVLKK